MSNQSVTVPQTIFLSTDDLWKVFDWRQAVDALRQAYGARATPAMVPPRSLARGDRLYLRALTAISPTGSMMGTKLIAASKKNKRVSYLISLFDQETTALLALLDASMVTGARTAATTALAIDLLTPVASKPQLKVAVLGSGFEAHGHIHALAAIRSIAQVSVFSPSPESRTAFAARLKHEIGLSVRVSDSPRAAVAGADVVICAARSRDETPTLLGEWLEPGMTVASIGSTLPEQREIDPAAIARSAVIVADMPDEVANDTGDMLAASAAGVEFESRLVALSELVAGDVTGRRAPEDIVLYKSVGSALQDVAISQMCFELARKLGIGTVLPISIVPLSK